LKAYYKQTKKFYKRHEMILIALVIIIGILGATSVNRMTSFSTSGIWEASADIAGVSVDGVYTPYSNLNAIEKSKTKVSWDPDGWAEHNSITSMNSVGLKPQVEVTVGPLFHVNKVGASIKETGPNEIETIDGVRYVRYYFGFSISLITRSAHPDMTEKYFDYYGDTIVIHENPNFASVKLAGDIGIKLAKLDDTVPTECGVQSFRLLDYETRYTSTENQGYSDDVSEFNRVYDWATYYHEGAVTSPDEYSMFSYYSLDADYSAKVNLESTLTPGSEYSPTVRWWSTTGSTFNVWDVELLAHFMCEVLLTYEVAADVAGYLDGRLDIGGIAEPEIYDLFYYLNLIFSPLLNWLMEVFGLADLWSALIILMLIIVSAIITLIILKKMLFNRGKTRMLYGM
jgi:hypothetical protein